MRYYIFVKGDGRGHLTQALALCQLLTSRGHQIAGIAVGAPQDALVPRFIFDRAPAPVVQLASPNFVLNKKATRISLMGTGLATLSNLGAYRQSLSEVGRLLQQHQPDVILNLYEPMLPLYMRLNKVHQPVISISHQHLMLHPQFTYPTGRVLERFLVAQYTSLVSYGTVKHLALSFYPMPDDPRHKVYPVAPLLREDVFARQPSSGTHYVVYMVYHGIADAVKAYNRVHPEQVIHAFWNKPGAPAEEKISDTLTFHQVNEKLFLDLLASSAGVATTAGFETVCEALYYGKPAILLPMPGQYEQYVNAFDAEKVGAGKMVNELNPALLSSFTEHYQPKRTNYLAWLQQGREKLVYHLENPTALA